ncbi:MAG TPA: PEP-CTERM sorting domain-containing protein [Bryobacteraceae bacterium]|nr:PEP-CTERM sorting domain-containing protein [Bryobacteraceae bacterium]
MRLVATAALAGPLAADPIPTYVATSASLNYTFTSGFTLESFSFVGPDLNLSGRGGSLFDQGPSGIEPGVPFDFSTFLIVNADGSEFSGTVGGVSTTFSLNSHGLVSAPGMVFNLTNGEIPSPLSNGSAPMTVPATASGTLSLCAPVSECAVDGGTQDLQVTIDIPGTVTLQIVNFGSPSTPLYRVSSAHFSTVPEPNTAVPLGLVTAVLFWFVRHRRMHE